MAVVLLVAAVWLGIPGVRPSRADLIAARPVVADSEVLILTSPCFSNLGATTEIDWVRGLVTISDLEVLPDGAPGLLRRELRGQGLGDVAVDFADPVFQYVSCDVAG